MIDAKSKLYVCSTSDAIVNKLINDVRTNNNTKAPGDWQWFEVFTRDIGDKNKCDYRIYIVSPNEAFLNTIVSVVDDSNKEPEKTILCILKESVPDRYEIGSDGKTPFAIHKSNKTKFNEFEMTDFNNTVIKCVKANGAVYMDSLEKVAYYLNSI